MVGDICCRLGGGLGIAAHFLSHHPSILALGIQCVWYVLMPADDESGQSLRGA